MNIEQIEVGDIILYDDPSTAVMAVKTFLNIRRKKLGLPADTRLYGHSGIIFKINGEFYLFETSTRKGQRGVIKTKWEYPTGVRKARIKVLTPVSELSYKEKNMVNTLCKSYLDRNIKYDWGSFFNHVIYTMSNDKIWLGNKNRTEVKFNCFEATTTVYNKLRGYFLHPETATSLDMIYCDLFRTKII